MAGSECVGRADIEAKRGQQGSFRLGERGIPYPESKGKSLKKTAMIHPQPRTHSALIVKELLFVCLRYWK